MLRKHPILKLGIGLAFLIIGLILMFYSESEFVRSIWTKTKSVRVPLVLGCFVSILFVYLGLFLLRVNRILALLLSFITAIALFYLTFAHGTIVYHHSFWN